MLLLLPCIAYALLFLVLREKRLDWRRACLTAAVFCGTCVVAITEILSVPRLISRWPVAALWSVVCAVSLLWLVSLKRGSQGQTPVESSSAESVDRSYRVLLTVSIFIVVAVGVLALVAAPNVWDAMEYHLPRASMWMGNHSVRLYATPDYAQLIYGPWAEFTMMHTELLWGGDRFVNMVEFLSFLLSAIGVSLIAKMLGAGPRGQILAAVACITIPEGILEASGPMNTYVVAFWIMATVFFLMLWNEDPSWLNTVCVGLSAGLAIFTKGSAYIVLPFLVLACWWMGSPATRIRFLKRSLVFVVLILAINGLHYYRNYQLTGSPLGFPLPSKYPRLQVVVGHVSVRGTLAGMMRNASIHVVTPSEGVNARIDRAFHSAIWKLGVDPDDSGQIYLDDPFHSNHFSLHEIHAGNPVHFVLIIVAISVVIWNWRRFRRQPVFWCAIGLLLSAVFFSAMLRWTEWSSRYQLPYFVLGAALAGFALERYLPRKAAMAMAALLLLFALPFTLANRIRSFVPSSRVENIYHSRDYQYFLDSHTGIAAANTEAASFVNRLPCDQVGVDTYLEHPVVALAPRSMFVYPLLAMIHANGGGRAAWYTGVQNDTIRYDDGRTPCAVICLECTRVREKWEEYRRIGGRASVFDYIVVFSGQGAIANEGSEAPAQVPAPSPADIQK